MLMLSLVVQWNGIKLLMITIVVQCIGNKLLMIRCIGIIIAYDKHRCAVH